MRNIATEDGWGIARVRGAEIAVASEHVTTARRHSERLTLPTERQLVVYTAVYDSVDAAKADLAALEQLHKDDFVGAFDAAVVDQENGKAHVAKRLDRPVVRVIPEWLGFGPMSRRELHEAGAELRANQAGLIVVGEPTLEKGFDKAVTRAKRVLKHAFDATADEISDEMKEAAQA
jgi:hypothetical protein